MTEQKTMRTAFVTGGSRGIGEAISRRLTLDGFAVTYTARDSSSLVRAKERYDRWFKKVRVNRRDRSQRVMHAPVGILLDLSDFARDPDKAWTALLSRWVPATDYLHALVNNAGICKQTPFEPESSPPFRDILDIYAVNLLGTQMLGRWFMTKMRSGSSIVNIASQLGKVGRAGFDAYAATKHGILGLTKCWAAYLGSRHIRVNAVCPCWTETLLNTQSLRQSAKKEGVTLAAFRARTTSHLTLRRFNTPKEVAAAVSFLVSDEASGITGCSIDMAGPLG